MQTLAAQNLVSTTQVRKRRKCHYSEAWTLGTGSLQGEISTPETRFWIIIIIFIGSKKLQILIESLFLELNAFTFRSQND